MSWFPPFVDLPVLDMGENSAPGHPNEITFNANRIVNFFRRDDETSYIYLDGGENMEGLTIIGLPISDLKRVLKGEKILRGES